jgi:hypothetical protein
MPSERAERARLRRQEQQLWPIRVFRLGEEPLLDPLDTSTVDERIAMMWPLARRAWELTGLPLPQYVRSVIPGHVQRGRR